MATKETATGKWYCYKCKGYHLAGSMIFKKHYKHLGSRKVGK
jgi:hypothetical protein